MSETSPPNGRPDLLQLINETITANEIYLHDSETSAYKSILDLINRAIDALVALPAELKTVNSYRTSARVFFVYHMLLPSTNGILISLLVGNIPACFHAMRMIIESLATCWYADSQQRSIYPFEDRLRSIEENGISSAKLMREMDGQLHGDQSILSLWKDLSSNWIHTSNYASRFVATIEDAGTAPSWHLTIPTRLGNEDSGAIHELESKANLLTLYLRQAMDSWPQ